MDRTRGGGIALSLGLLAALTGCGGGGGKPAAPEPSSQAAVTPTETAAPDPAQVYETLVKGLAENHPELWYDALPTRYQEDLDSTVQGVAADIDPELWNRFLQTTRKSLKVLHAKKEIVLSHPVFDSNGFFRREHLEQNWDALLGLVDAAVEGDDLELKKLSTASARDLLSGPLARLLQRFAAVSKTVEGDPYGEFVARLKRQKAEVSRRGGDEAWVQVKEEGVKEKSAEEKWVRVEGTWIPDAIATGWTKRLQAFRGSFGAGSFRKGLSAEQKMAALASFERLDHDLDLALKEEDPAEFQVKFTERFVVPAVSALAMLKPEEEPEGTGVTTAAAAEPAEAPSASPGKPAVVSSAVVIVNGELTPQARDEWQKRLGDVSDTPEFAICIPTLQGTATRFEVNPVGDVNKFAKRITFARVSNVDPESRTVTLELAKEP